LEDHGGSIAFETRVERMWYVAPHWLVQFAGHDAGTVKFDTVVNAAGLGAQPLARRIDGYPADQVPPLVLAKGNYFGFTGRSVFSRLIYPTPVDGGLGVHVTLDLAGRMRFGPDVEWIDHESYTVDPRRADSFYQRIRAYWPSLPDGSLVPDYCGIRPKLTGPGEKPADFMIAAEPAHGLPRLVNLFGIESPGLTSSLSLAEDVVDALAA
jgi:L-2-hydroxyglutarate oxidase LhgO